MIHDILYYDLHLFDFISAWPVSAQAYYAHATQRLLRFPPASDIPLIRSHGYNLFEILPRGQNRKGRAAFYAFLGQHIVVLHAFVKPSIQPSHSELIVAQHRQQHLLASGLRLDMPIHDTLIQQWQTDIGFKTAYHNLQDTFIWFDLLVPARLHAGLSPAKVAERIGTAPATISRLEGPAGGKQYTPSIALLRKYAQAVDCRLDVRLLPRCSYTTVH